MKKSVFYVIAETLAVCVPAAMAADSPHEFSADVGLRRYKMQKLMIEISSFAVCAFSFALLFAGWQDFAYATPTTHIWTPSTDVQAYKKWHLTSDFYMAAEHDANDERPSTITNFGLTVGVLPFEKLNAEIGFDHKSGTGVDDYPFYFNAKIGIPEGAFGKAFPAFAVGIYDVGTEDDKTDFNVAYFKAAKTISAGDFSLGRFSLGYFNGNADLLRNGAKKENDGALIAWERTLTEISDKVWVAVDYQGSKSAYGSLNLGFSYKFSDNTSVIFGYDIYNNRNLADTYTVQLDIDF